MSMKNLGFLIQRTGFSVLMLTHGYGKFLRLFEDKIKFSDPIGLGKELSLYLAVLGEFIAPIFIIIGLKTRFFSIFPIITMYVAAFISHAGGDSRSCGSDRRGGGTAEYRLCPV